MFQYYYFFFLFLHALTCSGYCGSPSQQMTFLGFDLVTSSLRGSSLPTTRPTPCWFLLLSLLLLFLSYLLLFLFLLLFFFTSMFFCPLLPSPLPLFFLSSSPPSFPLCFCCIRATMAMEDGCEGQSLRRRRKQRL